MINNQKLPSILSKMNTKTALLVQGGFFYFTNSPCLVQQKQYLPPQRAGRRTSELCSGQSRTSRTRSQFTYAMNAMWCSFVMPWSNVRYIPPSARSMFNVCSLSDFCAFSGSSFLPQHENSAFPVPVNIAPHSGQTRIFILLMCPSCTRFRSARRRAAPFRVHAENRAQIIYQRHVGIT